MPVLLSFKSRRNEQLGGDELPSKDFPIHGRGVRGCALTTQLLGLIRRGDQ